MDADDVRGVLAPGGRWQSRGCCQRGNRRGRRCQSWSNCRHVLSMKILYVLIFWVDAALDTATTTRSSLCNQILRWLKHSVSFYAVRHRHLIRESMAGVMVQAANSTALPRSIVKSLLEAEKRTRACDAGCRFCKSDRSRKVSRGKYQGLGTKVVAR